ncbi:MAG: hypothetical protein QXL01_00555 [Thermoplasmatales archaeon]
MNKFLLALLLSISGCLTVPKKEVPTNFYLNQKTVQIVGLLFPITIKNTLEDLRKIPINEKTFIYFHSIGGNMIAGQELYNEVKKRDTVCIATLAGGLSYSIFQACKVRLLYNNSILSRFKYDAISQKDYEKLKSFIQEMENTELSSINKTAEEYAQLFEDGVLYMDNSRTSVSLRLADGIAQEHCADNITLSRVFGDKSLYLILHMTGCPSSRQLISFEPKELKQIPNFEVLLNTLLQIINIPLSVEVAKRQPI